MTNNTVYNRGGGATIKTLQCCKFLNVYTKKVGWARIMLLLRHPHGVAYKQKDISGTQVT